VSNNKPAAAAFITTIYAGDKLDYVKQSLDSLTAQSYGSENIHIYLYVDGPLPDAHEAFLAVEGHRLYRIIRGKTNRGLTHGLNTLIDALEEEDFVLRMDLDDIAHEQRVEKQVTYLQVHPEISLVGCWSHEIDETGTIVSQRDYPETPGEIRNAIARGNAMLHPAYCLRRDVLSTHGLRYRNLYLNEDLGFLFDLLAADLLPSNMPDRLMFWRVTGDFFRRRHVRRHFVEFRVFVAGIYQLHGVSTKLIYPAVRLVFRFLPNAIARQVYRSDFRNRFLRG
jgi:hypothetical protein